MGLVYEKPHAKAKLIIPFLITSIPAAYLGGSIELPKKYFYLALMISLIFVAMQIYFWRNTTLQLNLKRSSKLIISFISGALLGLIAGIVGSFFGSFKLAPKMEKTEMIEFPANSVTPLKEYFNQNKEKVRFLALLSPT